MTPHTRVDYLLVVGAEEPVTDPCSSSPCGPNAECNNGACSCLPEYSGNPYIGCRPECVLSNDCAHDKACIRNKCVDPCPGACAQNALCRVINHVPMCSCPPQTNGNALILCSPVRGIIQLLNRGLKIEENILMTLKHLNRSALDDETLQPVPMRSEQYLQRGERPSCVHLRARVPWDPASMQTRMHDQCGLP